MGNCLQPSHSSRPPKTIRHAPSTPNPVPAFVSSARGPQAAHSSGAVYQKHNAAPRSGAAISGAPSASSQSSNAQRVSASSAKVLDPTGQARQDLDAEIFHDSTQSPQSDESTHDGQTESKGPKFTSPRPDAYVQQARPSPIQKSTEYKPPVSSGTVQHQPQMNMRGRNNQSSNAFESSRSSSMMYDSGLSSACVYSTMDSGCGFGGGGLAGGGFGVGGFGVGGFGIGGGGFGSGGC